MNFTGNEDAVSEVISVVLMIALAVMLAAVIAAFLFGMTGNISKTKVLSVTLARQDPTHVTATYKSGTDSQALIGITFTVNGGSPVGTMGFYAGGSPVTAGKTIIFSAPQAHSHVIAIGQFVDGSRQVLLDTYV